MIDTSRLRARHGVGLHSARFRSADEMRLPGVLAALFRNSSGRNHTLAPLVYDFTDPAVTALATRTVLGWSLDDIREGAVRGQQ